MDIQEHRKIYICELQVSTPFEFLVCIKYWSSCMLSTTRPPFLLFFLSCVVCFGLFWFWLFYVGFTFAPLDCKLVVGFSDLYYAGFILYVTFVLPIFTQMIAWQQQQPHQHLGIYWWVMVVCYGTDFYWKHKHDKNVTNYFISNSRNLQENIWTCSLQEKVNSDINETFTSG